MLAESENTKDNASSLCRESCPQAAVVVLALQNCPYQEVRRIAVEFPTSDVIRLQGAISSYYLKQMAQEIVRKAVPQCRIENRLQVTGAHTDSTLKPR